MQNWQKLAYSEAPEKKHDPEVVEIAGDEEVNEDKVGSDLSEESESDSEKIAHDELSKNLHAIREYLKTVPGHSFVTFDVLEKAVGVDLDLKTEVLNKLKRSEDIVVDVNQIKFKAKYPITNLDSLMTELKKHERGILYSDVLNCSANKEFAHEFISEAITLGLVYCIKPTRGRKEKSVLFDKGSSFLVPLSGTFIKQTKEGKTSLKCLDSDILDVTKEVRRGDAVIVDWKGVLAYRDKNYIQCRDYCRRVSADVTNIDKRKQPPYEPGTCFRSARDQVERNAPPFTTSSTAQKIAERKKQDLQYRYIFNHKKLPLAPEKLPVMPNVKRKQLEEDDDEYETERNANKLTLYKHGCTNDVRDLWAKVSNLTPYNAKEDSLKLCKLLKDKKLITQDEIDRDFLNKAPRVKKEKIKKRRRVNMTNRKALTNMHMLEEYNEDKYV
uniref:Transcription initiation factor IIE subunit beta n=1 Tax=Aplanochytrium stocchinoi TaxID=215587 RepID=A0A7S3V0Z6_9STRA|mmetsp:Transcript_13828/g.16047  ORF Transcript_13828/g.16047 Transcript_13828/m.16047 type:complete len:441 (-) Transcript_13828:765-2087(-)|eukprot:CAMPEP_0204835726 /NCGR_PEP_ID=MMETSP1346-20131115/23454_1 /ASSEMBLY_ACC=CAM_ASM_000771 /TAXON_ID=215587 /ORGANISM="Aplanochytrium stocchinoi, Strain GSBS06" /LENGTH=440 /DNA_ID=CAMNT_0051969975 /DNA_START=212 /DNA_END=1534 /DNA_ORIENTATION=+